MSELGLKLVTTFSPSVSIICGDRMKPRSPGVHEFTLSSVRPWLIVDMAVGVVPSTPVMLFVFWYAHRAQRASISAEICLIAGATYWSYTCSLERSSFSAASMSSHWKCTPNGCPIVTVVYFRLIGCG